MKESFEGTARGEGLSKTNGGDNWSLWEGRNTSGRITVQASFPSLLDKTNNTSWIVFTPGAETSAVLSEAMLAHLLAKAEKTTIAAGDAVELKMPWESLFGGCMVSYGVRVRMMGAELLSTSATFTCPVAKK